MLNKQISTSTTTTAFFITGAINVTLSSSYFRYCGVASLAGVFSLTSSSLYDSGSTFEFNAGAQGGAISSTNSKMSLYKTIFSTNLAHRGGCITLDTKSYMLANQVKFDSNIGYLSGGVMYVSTESYFAAVDCSFTNNYANETSTIEVLGSSSTNNITISSCNFEKNSASKNTISLMYSNV